MKKKESIGDLKVAIVHDWLIGGGAELVVLELHRMFPEAPIYTSYATKEWRQRLDGKVVTGWLQYWPLSKLRKFIPFLRISWFGQLNLKKYDLVISSTGAEAKGINKLKKGAIHICYMHAPTHYYWSRYNEYLNNPGFGPFDPLARLGLGVLVGPLRKWDYKAAQGPHYVIANSNHIKQQISEFYDRDATVIHPPIDTDRFGDGATEGRAKQKRQGFVITGRQTPYKRVDLAVAACTQLGLPLKVIGNGPDHEKLKKMAGPTITFLGYVKHEELPTHLAGAEAFLFPGLDDFGISPVEAMAAGTPVIAYKGGGALDYVIPGKTGEFFTKQTADSLAHVLKNFDSTKYDAAQIQAHAQKFSKESFQNNVQNFLYQCATEKGS